MGDSKRRKSMLAGQVLNLFSAETLTLMPKESKSIHSDPDLAFKFCSQGIEEAYQNADPEQALYCFDRAISLDSNYADAYYHRGNLRQKLFEHSKALRDVDRAIALDNQLIDAYLLRGILKHENLTSLRSKAGREDILTANHLAQSQNDCDNLYLATEILLDWDYFDSISQRISITGSHSIIKRFVDKVLIFDKITNSNLACQQVKSQVINAAGYDLYFSRKSEIGRIIELWVKKLQNIKIRKSSMSVHNQ